jgi:hypothetical protein
VDRVKLLIEARERFNPSHKTLAVALALLSQHVTITTVRKAVIQADAAVSKQPECFQAQGEPPYGISDTQPFKEGGHH